MQKIPYRDLDFATNYKTKSVKSLKRKAKLRALIRAIIPNGLFKYIILNACVALVGYITPIALGIVLFLFVLYILFVYPIEKLLKLIDKIYFRGKYFDKKSNSIEPSNKIEEVIIKKTYSHQPLFEKNFYKNTFRDLFNDDKVFLCLSVCAAFCASAIHAVSILIHFIK